MRAKNGWFIVGFAVAVMTGAGRAWARMPDWVQPLLAQDVGELGRNHRLVTLADLGEVRYDNTGHVRRTYRMAVRVLTENGRAAARCSFPYNADTERVIAAHAWIVSADGKRTETFSTNDFGDNAANIGGTFWPQHRRLTFVAESRVAVNGVFLWEIEIESQASVNDVTWFFPIDTPTLLCAYDVVPPSGGTLAWHASTPSIPPPVAGAVAGALHWEERNFRPPSGGERPAGFLPTPRMLSVRAVASGKGKDMTWADMAGLACDVMEPRIAAASPELKAKATALVSGKAAHWDRVRALAAFVQREITYLAVTLDKDCFAGYRPHPASEVLSNRFGDCKDKATLLIAMLRAVGEEGRPMLVFAGNPTAVQADWPSPRFNHVIVCIPADADVPATWATVDGGSAGRYVLFDPTDPGTPLGWLPYADQAGYGLIVARQSTDLVRLPQQTDEKQVTVDLKLDAAGGAVIHLEQVCGGVLGAGEHGLREDQAGARFTEGLEHRIHETVPYVEDMKWTDAWDGAKSQWELKVDLKAPRYARRAGDLLILNPHVMASRRSSPWKTRVEGVVWSPGVKFHQAVRVSLPAGARIEELPEKWSGESSNLRAVVRYERNGDTVSCETEVAVPGAFLDREKYEGSRLLLQKIEAAERRPIVLRLPANDVAAKAVAVP